MAADNLRSGKDKERGEQQGPVSPLRERARAAAEALHSDNSCRWFPLRDVFPVYNYLYDYHRSRREDMRLRGQAEEALEHLNDIARRLEENAVHPLPPEWEDAKAALADATQIFRTITRAW
ncbi:MAG: hypothetical protein JSV65_06795 [Armatimonadota bacterium]|nr:MAG: hypothetical protein JSV65_06795 [Armatimonadota bacterium]